MSKTHLTSVVLSLWALSLAIGCESRDLDTVGQPDNPLVLLLSPLHSASPEALVALTDALQSESGISIQLRVAPDEPSAVTMAGSYLVDGAILPLFDYLFCRQEYGVQAALQVTRQSGACTYTGSILVRADSPISSLAELDGKNIAFVSSYSTSGFLYPAALIKAAGATPIAVFAGSHEAALAELKAGRVDAAATYSGAAGGDPSVRAIAQTGEIPDEPLFFRADLSPELRQRLTDALVRYASTEAGARVLRELADITGFVPITDADYLEVHDQIRAAGVQVEDLVPNAWRIRNQNRLRPADHAP